MQYIDQQAAPGETGWTPRPWRPVTADRRRFPFQKRSMPPSDDGDPPLSRLERIALIVAASVATLGIVPLLFGLIFLVAWIGIRIETAVRRWIGRPLRLTWRERRRLRRR